MCVCVCVCATCWAICAATHALLQVGPEAISSYLPHKLRGPARTYIEHTHKHILLLDWAWDFTMEISVCHGASVSRCLQWYVNARVAHIALPLYPPTLATSVCNAFATCCKRGTFPPLELQSLATYCMNGCVGDEMLQEKEDREFGAGCDELPKLYCVVLLCTSCLLMILWMVLFLWFHASAC